MVEGLRRQAFQEHTGLGAFQDHLQMKKHMRQDAEGLVETQF